MHDMLTQAQFAPQFLRLEPSFATERQFAHWLATATHGTRMVYARCASLVFRPSDPSEYIVASTLIRAAAWRATEKRDVLLFQKRLAPGWFEYQAVRVRHSISPAVFPTPRVVENWTQHYRPGSRGWRRLADAA